MGFAVTDNRTITDNAINQAFQRTDFGPVINMSINARRAFLGKACLKVLAGYHNGSTITNIMLHLSLIEAQKGGDFLLTKKGNRFVYETYS